MSYMLLIVEQPGERDVDAEEGQRRYEVMHAFAAGLDSRGLLTSAESLLTPDETGVRVRRRGGKNATVDGPFAEAKEIIGGFFLLKAKTREEAVAIAGECPAAEWSIVEVRELGPCWDGARQD
ncbi:MAG: hypothetical protein KDJ86_02460 [Bauldia sp.]|uniref:YciI family protein n=1 Tax=Bauldia sp. TaxID=2575872 RepID=UPI001D37E78D|nr:YciI family protein [Bauldia sp.]MCB1494623.1 hypothetical protein [Bauldia sp.]